MDSTFVVDLDLPETCRWSGVLEKRAGDARQLICLARPLMDQVLPRAARWLASMVTCPPCHLQAEMRQVARLCDVPLVDVYCFQLVMEMWARGGIVYQAGPGYHAVLAGSAPELASAVRGAMIAVNFTRSGRVVANAVTWPGYVGCLHGMRTLEGIPDVALSSIHSPEDDHGRRNTWLLLGQGHWWSGALVRAIITGCDTENAILERIQSEPLVHPCTFVLTGTRSSIVARTRTRVARYADWRSSLEGLALTRGTGHASPAGQMGEDPGRARFARVRQQGEDPTDQLDRDARPEVHHAIVVFRPGLRQLSIKQLREEAS